VILLNKWDLLDEDRRDRLDREIDRELGRVGWAARLNISARTGRGLRRIAPALHAALEAWESRIPTAELNAFLGAVVAATPPPVRGGKQPKVLFATQAGVAPPRFVLFTSGPLEASYRRFLERRLREQFGFAGTPIELNVRARDKRKAGR
jgi:GTP-binding protein